MGKSGGGGGGSSGKVEWPAYFMTWHGKLLGTGSITAAADSAISTAQAANPFTAMAPYNPATLATAMVTKADGIATTVAAVVPGTEYHDAIVSAKTALEDHVFSTTELVAAETAFNAIIDADYNNSALPRFQRGMQDINAVISSSFTTGAALLSAEVVRKKAQFSSELRLQSYREKVTNITAGGQQIVSRYQAVHALTTQIVNTQIEARRLNITMLKEEQDEKNRIEESEAKWALEILTMGGHILAAGQGGVGGTTAKATPFQSAVGGALSGAAVGGMAAAGYGALTAGSMAAGPIGWGIGIGALLGGAMGLFG